MFFDKDASYTPDMAGMIDQEEEIIADEFGVSLKTAFKIIKLRDDACRRDQAEILGRAISIIIAHRNPQMMLKTLALAFGLDAMNSHHSQSELARELNVSRALISHYVIGWVDILRGKNSNFDCLKFRKKESTRETYQANATSSFIQAKMKANKKKK